MDRTTLKIAFVVPGRFDAFELAKALLDRGEEVTVFTNYPKWAAKRFGLNPPSVCSFWMHGIISRIAWYLNQKIKMPYPEAALNKMFGRWAEKNILKRSWDIIYTWSGFSEEVLCSTANSSAVRILKRGSSHIRAQKRLLEEEEERCGRKIEKPSAWIISREEREYGLTDRIRVPSSFARDSFLSQGLSEEKLFLLPSAVVVKDFRPSPHVIEERVRRIKSGEPLRILYTGSILFRKGIFDMAKITRKLSGGNFQFYLVGPVAAEAVHFLKEFSPKTIFIRKQPQGALPEWYNKADLFIFPTIEDGFAVVLSQAKAAGLPIIATTNCAAPDIVRQGETGWVLPIRSPELFVEKLLWCDQHRTELALMARNIYYQYEALDEVEMARDFSAIRNNITRS